MNRIVPEFQKVLLLFLSIVLLTACGTSRRSIAIEEGWELLGESKANFVRDKDVIEVLSSNSFTHIRFRVEDKEIRLSELNVFFVNGDKLSPQIDEVIPAGKESRNIELAQEGRQIRRIEFKYRSTGNVLDGRANILVFGKRYTTGF